MNNRTNMFERNNSIYPETDKKIPLAVKGIVAVAIFGALVYAGSYFNGGSRSPEKLGDVNQLVESVTISPDSNLRYDPYVGNDDNINIVEPVDKTITIKNNNDIRVHDDSANGNWYGIPVTEIEKQDPSFNDRGDNDGVIWVNQQGAEVKIHDRTSDQFSKTE